MKKTYNCPDVEVIAINAMTALCESLFGPFNINNDPSDIVDPNNGGL